MYFIDFLKNFFRKANVGSILFMLLNWVITSGILMLYLRPLWAAPLVGLGLYVVGLADAYRGRGLGAPTVSMGLRHLREGGARRVILYVEDDNVAAVERYRADGFTVAEEHVVYSADPAR